MSPRNPSDEALIPDIMVFGGGAFGRQLSGWDFHDRISVLIRRGRGQSALSLPGDDTAGRWPSASQEEGPHGELSLLAP